MSVGANRCLKVFSGLLRLAVTCDQIVLCRFRSVWCFVQIAMHLNVCFTIYVFLCSAIPWNCPRCKHSWKRSKSSNFWTEACKQKYCHLLARSPIIFTLQKDEINQVCKIHPQIFPRLNTYLMQSASVGFRILLPQHVFIR